MDNKTIAEHLDTVALEILTDIESSFSGDNAEMQTKILGELIENGNEKNKIYSHFTRAAKEAREMTELRLYRILSGQVLSPGGKRYIAGFVSDK